jgi:ribosomal protein S27AE
MITIYETDGTGATKVWEADSGNCPECGSDCSIDTPKTPETPFRLLCFSCGYAEGHDFQQTG